MQINIALVAPFHSLYQTAQQVVAERDGEIAGRVMLFQGDMYEGAEYARQAAAQGVDALVSRGGTALLIAQEIKVPVVPIQVSALDIMRALKKLGRHYGPIGVVGFWNVIYECADLGELLDVDLRPVTLESIEEAPERLAVLLRGGVRVIIGDHNSVLVAERLGMRGVLIESGRDAVYKAIKEAEHIALVRRKEQERAELLKTIIDSATDGIIAIGEDECINIYNPVAESIFGLPREQVLGRPVKRVIPNTRLPRVLASGKAEIGEVQIIGEKKIATKRIPIKIKEKVVGVVAHFQEVTELQRFEQAVRRKLHGKGLCAKTTLADIIGASPVLEEVKKRAVRFARTSATVLITGESGTGKEMFAQSIHNLSPRRRGPFVAVNCAALPENLLESELFGYEEGAFTGARRGGKAGLFELAHGGTIFLDEIGEMPLALQARLLRVLQEKEVMRLGGHRVIPVDVRVIAATNRDLAALVEQKQFRPDLYYRLNTLRLHVPPLRQRQEDVAVLTSHFLRVFNSLNPTVVCASNDAVALLQRRPWPGNVRELMNVLERAVLLANGPEITANDIRQALALDEGEQDEDSIATHLAHDCLHQVERETIERVLREENYNYTRAALRLGVNRTTLWRKMTRWRQVHNGDTN